MTLHRIRAEITSRQETIAIEIHEDKIIATKKSTEGKKKLRWLIENQNAGNYEDIIKLVEYLENMLLQGNDSKVVIDESNQNMKDYAIIIDAIYNMVEGNLQIEKGSNTISKAYDAIEKFI